MRELAQGEGAAVQGAEVRVNGRALGSDWVLMGKEGCVGRTGLLWMGAGQRPSDSCPGRMALATAGRQRIAKLELAGWYALLQYPRGQC